MAYPSFDESVARFREFLVRQGRSTDIVWLTRDDLAVFCHRLFVRLPDADGEPLARIRYAEGVQQGLGISLEMFACLDRRSCAAVYVPTDLEDAWSRLIPDDVKLTIPDRPLPAKLVKGWAFRWLTRFDSRNTIIDESLDMLHRTTA